MLEHVRRVILLYSKSSRKKNTIIYQAWLHHGAPTVPQSNEEYSALPVWVYDDKFMGITGYTDTNEIYPAHVIILAKEFYRVG